MYGNRGQKYYVPKFVCKFSIAALICLWHTQTCLGRSDDVRRTAMIAPGFGRDAFIRKWGGHESPKGASGSINEDTIIDDLYARNDEDESVGYNPGSVPTLEDYVDYEEENDLEYVTFEGIGQSEVFPDGKRGGFDEDIGNRSTENSAGQGSSKDHDIGNDAGNDTVSGPTRGNGNHWHGFDTENRFRDPFNRDNSGFDANKQIDIPGLLKSNAAVSKFSVIIYLIIFSAFVSF